MHVRGSAFPLLSMILAGATIAACSSGSTDTGPVSQSTSSLKGGCDEGDHAFGDGDEQNDDGDTDVSDIKKGQNAFLHGIRTGNGRQCATCHVPRDAFMLKPASVERRFNCLPKDKDGNPKVDHDPLFNSIDANDSASDFTNLRKGLVRITLPLPPNVTIDELPGATTISVWRKVPTVRDSQIHHPYQLDGRAATLQIQAQGAVVAHSQATLLDTETLDQIAAFESAQFSNDRSRDIAAALLAGTPAPSPFPTDLTEQETRGQTVFTRKCAGCHGGPTMDQCVRANNEACAVGAPKTPDRQMFQNVLSNLTSTRNANNLPLYTIRCTNAAGVVTIKRGRPDPGRVLISGDCSDISRFEARPLFDVKNHAPYFHDGQAQTLAEVLDTYNNFFFQIPNSPTGQTFGPPMTTAETADVLAFLNRL